MDLRILSPDASELQTLAHWYHREWGHEAGLSVDDELRRLQRAPDQDGLPCVLAAFEQGEVVGAVQLKRQEMQDFPQYEHWLGSVFVAASHRGRGMAGLLVTQAAAMARARGIQQLYLQTESLDGGLYARLGWQPVTRAETRGHRVLVMVRTL